MKIRLVIEIDAYRPKDANDLAGVISDYADEQFEVITIERGRPMNLRSWVWKPNRASGDFVLPPPREA